MTVATTETIRHGVGDIDVRGALGVDDQVGNGYQAIRVHFEVEGDAPAEKLRELVPRPLATVSHGRPVP
jgi:hypothetical protein